MTPTSYAKILTLLAFALGAGTLPLAARAQEPEPFATFLFPKQWVGYAFDQGNLDDIAVYADGELCAQVEFTPDDYDPQATGEVVLPVGLPVQPEACSTPGAYITWRTSLLPGEDMAARFRLQEGAAMYVTTLAPLIPEITPPLDTESATIVFPEEVWDQPIPGRGGPTWSEVVRVLSIEADGERCTLSGTFPGEVRIGGPYQPAACSRDGALLTFVPMPYSDQPGPRLDTAFTLVHGSTYVLDSVAPLPPPMGDPAPEGQVVATVLVPGDLLRGESGNPDYDTVGDAFGSVGVYANGERCGTIDLANQQPRDAAGNAILELGAAGQPDPCRSEGALITFRLAHQPDETLITTYWLEQGATLRLENFAATPPTTGGPSNGEPGDAPDPPAAGTGPGRSENSSPALWLATAGLVLAAVSGASFWVARRSA